MMATTTSATPAIEPPTVAAAAVVPVQQPPAAQQPLAPHGVSAASRPTVAQHGVYAQHAAQHCCRGVALASGSLSLGTRLPSCRGIQARAPKVYGVASDPDRARLRGGQLLLGPEESNEFWIRLPSSMAGKTKTRVVLLALALLLLTPSLSAENRLFLDDAAGAGRARGSLEQRGLH